MRQQERDYPHGDPRPNIHGRPGGYLGSNVAPSGFRYFTPRQWLERMRREAAGEPPPEGAPEEDWIAHLSRPRFTREQIDAARLFKWAQMVHDGFISAALDPPPDYPVSHELLWRLYMVNDCDPANVALHGRQILIEARRRGMREPTGSTAADPLEVE
jgi:hypothetical protein